MQPEDQYIVTITEQGVTVEEPSGKLEQVLWKDNIQIRMVRIYTGVDDPWVEGPGAVASGLERQLVVRGKGFDPCHGAGSGPFRAAGCAGTRHTVDPGVAGEVNRMFGLT